MEDLGLGRICGRYSYLIQRMTGDKIIALASSLAQSNKRECQMRRVSTVGETRYKVWRLTTGLVSLEIVEVEFDSPNEEWICDPRFKWGKKSNHNKIDKATGRCKYSDGFNKQLIFSDKSKAEAYQKQLENENLILVPVEPGMNKFTVRYLDSQFI